MTPKDNIPSFLTHFGPYKQCMYDVQKTARQPRSEFQSCKNMFKNDKQTKY